jgi:hypothetical protein
VDESQQPEAVLRRMLQLPELELESFVIHELSTDAVTLAAADVKIGGTWYRIAVRYIPREQEVG